MFRSLFRRSVPAGVVLSALSGFSASASGQTTTTCATPQWVGAWAAAPSSASPGFHPLDVFDASANPKVVPRNATVRVVITPNRGGSTARIRLSNRFGRRPVRFGRATIARQTIGSGIATESLTELTFGGARGVVAPAGQDVLSDPAPITVAAFQRLSVSVHVAEPAGRPTEHYLGRQTSYLTLPGAGDQTTAAGGSRFPIRTTTRPYVLGVDVQSGTPAGAVVAFGDSITDGYEPGFGVLESARGLNRDVRYPDFLARRIQEAGLGLSVLNMGISSNRILSGPGWDSSAGPRGLDRLDADVLKQPGVSTAVVLLGINDLAGSPRASSAAVIGGLTEITARLRASGVRVLLGTLTPARGGPAGAGLRSTDARRQVVNAWIRTQAQVDGVVDFDAVVRHPTDPSRLAPAFDGGDRLHLSAAGNRALADVIPLDLLAPARC